MPQSNAIAAQAYVEISERTPREVVTFTDDNEIIQKQAVRFLQTYGVINGYGDGSFGPKNNVSRAEALKMVYEAAGTNLPEANGIAFSDVPVNEWYAKYVKDAFDKGYINGFEDGTFRPSQTVTKAELLKIAFQVFGVDAAAYPVTDLPRDVESSAWYTSYVQYAVDANLVTLNNGRVFADIGMTRENFADVIYRLMMQQERL